MARKTGKKRGRPVTVNTEEAAEHAARMLACGCRKHEVRTALNNQFRGKPRISVRSFIRILARARQMLVDDDGRTRKDLRLDARRFYESVRSDLAAKTVDRIQAQEALDKLYGLPITRVVHSGTGEGGAIKTENTTTLDISKLPAEKLRQLRDIRALAAASSNGHHSNGHSNGHSRTSAPEDN